MKNAINKLMTIALTGMMMFAAEASASGDALISFSTKGPDCYADGTSVLAGEVYALVWTRNGCEFAGIDMNGKVLDEANNELITAKACAKVNKKGAACCPLTLFQLDAEFAASHANGDFQLILLDTRVSDGNGGFKASGDMHQVQGWGVVADSRVKAVASTITKAAGASKAVAKTTTLSAEPAGEVIPQPVITKFDVKDGMITLTVKGTTPRLMYNVEAGNRPNRFAHSRVAMKAIQGNASAEREVTITVPVADGQNFFRVTRN